MNLSSAWFLLMGIPLLQASEKPGIKMTIEHGSNGLPSQRTIYLQADRKRVDYQNSFGQKQSDGSMRPIYGPRLVAITRCDLGQSFELNLDRPEFVTVGEPGMGFAFQFVVSFTTQSKLPDGTQKLFDSKMETRVTQFEAGPLDPALFEIPAGFKQVDRIGPNSPNSAFANPPRDFWERIRVRVGLFGRQ